MLPPDRGAYERAATDVLDDPRRPCDKVGTLVCAYSAVDETVH